MALAVPEKPALNCAESVKSGLVYDDAVRHFANRDIDAAVRAFDLAESLGYDANICASYRWQCRMLLGQFEQAWRESDLIASRTDADPHGLWDGRPFHNNRVVVRCLHGYGDAIQFIRYAELLRQTAARVIVETHPEMVSLLRRVPFADEVITWSGRESLPRDTWDQQIEVTELPRAFRTTLGTIPASFPYIHVERGARERSLRNLTRPEGLRVGLVWASSMWNPARCIRLAQLIPVLDCGRCTFYNFQRGPRREEIAELPGRYQLHDTSGHSPEIVDTAADLTNMDLLITVDTMAAHLAGALGRKVWTLLPYEADWRWMLGRDDTPWYPAMRLFRQPAQGEWGPVVDRIARELKRLAG